MRQQALPVVIYILRTAPSQKILNLIAPRIPNVLRRIENTLMLENENDKEGLHHLVKIISTLMLKYPVKFIIYKEIVRNKKRSMNKIARFDILFNEQCLFFLFQKKILDKYDDAYDFHLLSKIKPWLNVNSECIICYEHAIDSVLYKCGHMCMCYGCAVKQWGKGRNGYCSICRARIKDVIRTYKP